MSAAFQFADHENLPYLDVKPIWLTFKSRPLIKAEMINVTDNGIVLEIESDARSELLWPLHLKHGDEIEITGLIDGRINAWVIGIEKNIVRLRFLHTPETRTLLQKMLAA